MRAPRLLAKIADRIAAARRDAPMVSIFLFVSLCVRREPARPCCLLRSHCSFMIKADFEAKSGLSLKDRLCSIPLFYLTHRSRKLNTASWFQKVRSVLFSPDTLFTL
jgi:hypothetical protein